MINRITIIQNKLKQQQQLYETVRADRNHYSKGLLESQDEIAELKKKFKIMGHQIEQLKGSTGRHLFYVFAHTKASVCLYVCILRNKSLANKW